MVPFSVKVWLNASSHMMLASCRGSDLHSMCFTNWPNNNNRRSTLFTGFRRHYTAKYANLSPFSRYAQPRHTSQAECMKFE